MRHILASLDSVGSAADRIQKEAEKPSCLRGDLNPDRQGDLVKLYLGTKYEIGR